MIIVRDGIIAEIIVMGKYIVLLCVIGCSSEPVGNSSAGQTNDCYTTYQAVDTNYCATIYCYECKNGDKGCGTTPALGANYVGQWCLKEGGQTYYYVCGVNNQNEAWVYCNYHGQ